MRRRTFIAGLGSAAAWPVVARAQQAAIPVVGWLDNQSPETEREFLPAFRMGLAETGYVEGRNVIVEYHWAENDNDRLSALAADLVRRHVALIVASGTSSALAAKAATQTIPIVFSTGGDPVALGLVAIGANHECACPQLSQGCKDQFKVPFGARMQDMELHP